MRPRGVLGSLIAGAFLATSALPGAAQALDEVRIGAILPMTGGAASYGQWMRQGMDIAIDEISAEWGGSPELNVIYEDSKTNPKDAVQAMNKLTSVDDAHAIMTTLTGVTKALAPVATQNEIVLTTSATLPGLTEESEYLFRNSTNLGSEISRLVEFASARYDSAAVLAVNLEWAQWGRDAFVEGFESAGGEIVETQSFPPESNDLRAQLTKIKAANPEVLLVLAYKTTGVALKQARELGVEAPFIGTLDFELPEVTEIAKEAANGAIYTKAAFDPESPSSQATKAYVAEYEERYGELPEVYSATMYDMLHMLADAVKECEADTPCIRKTLLGIENYPGASGVTTFLPNGDVDKPVNLKTIKDGKYVDYNPEG